MTAWGVTFCIALAIGLVACSDDPEDSSPTTEESSSTTSSTAPEREASTTTTAFDPASVEGEVEAAYLKSWDVYADAVYDLVLDEDALAEVYAAEALATVRAEVERRIDDDSASLVRVDHDYEVALSGASSANVIDRLVNHQVLIDAETKEPTEEDPNERQLLNFRLELIDSRWRVTEIERVDG